MGVVVQDGFTVGSDVDLKDHVPDTTGTGWTELENTGTTTTLPRILAADDFVQLNAEDSDDRKLNTAQPGPINAEYDVEVDFLDNSGSNRPGWVLGRVVDSDNYYAAGHFFTAGTDMWLVKKVASTVTDLASADTDVNWVSSTTFKLELRDAAKKVYVDDSEKLSNGDNALTSAGEGGVGWGNIRKATDIASTAPTMDNFLVTEVAGSGGGAAVHYYAQQ